MQNFQISKKISFVTNRVIIDGNIENVGEISIETKEVVINGNVELVRNVSIKQHSYKWCCN